MKPVPLLVAALSFIAGGLITIAIIRWMNADNPELLFGMGSILGTQIGAIMHHRQPGATPNFRAKAMLGAVLALSTIALAMALHLTIRPFKFVEVSLPISTIGAFAFPFVIFNTMWKSLSSVRNPDSKG